MPTAPRLREVAQHAVDVADSSPLDAALLSPGGVYLPAAMFLFGDVPHQSE
jgi:hypothetical protein